MLITKYIFSILAIFIFLGTFAFGTARIIKRDANKGIAEDGRFDYNKELVKILHMLKDDKSTQETTEVNGEDEERSTARIPHDDEIYNDRILHELPLISDRTSHKYPGATSEEDFGRKNLRELDSINKEIEHISRNGSEISVERTTLAPEESVQDDEVQSDSRTNKKIQDQKCGTIFKKKTVNSELECISFTGSQMIQLTKIAIQVKEMEVVINKDIKQNILLFGKTLKECLSQKKQATTEKEKAAVEKKLMTIKKRCLAYINGLVRYNLNLQEYYNNLVQAQLKLVNKSERTEIFQAYKDRFMSLLLEDYYYIAFKANLEAKKAQKE